MPHVVSCDSIVCNSLAYRLLFFKEESTFLLNPLTSSDIVFLSFTTKLLSSNSRVKQLSFSILVIESRFLSILLTTRTSLNFRLSPNIFSTCIMSKFDSFLIIILSGPLYYLRLVKLLELYVISLLTS